MAPHFMFDELDPMEESTPDFRMKDDYDEPHEDLPEELDDIEEDEYDFPATAGDGDPRDMPEDEEDEDLD